MSKQLIYEPQFAIHPGVHLKEILEAQGISQVELSQRTCITRKLINEIINGKSGISVETAYQLEPVLGLPSTYWLHLQANYDATVKRLSEIKGIEESNNYSEEKEWVKSINYKELADLGFTKMASTISQRIYNLRKLTKVSNLTCIDKLALKGAARRANVIGNTKEDLLWRQIAIAKATEIPLKKYSKDKLEKLAENLRRYTLYDDINSAIKLLSESLSDCGIALVLMPHLKNSGFNGYSEKISKGYMIIVTLRGKNADGFWFSLLHEISHILLGHVDVPTTDDIIKKKREEEANIMAANFLIKPEEFKQFDTRYAHSEVYLKEFSKKIGVHPCIVRGRLCNEGLISYSEMNRLKLLLQFV